MKILRSKKPLRKCPANPWRIAAFLLLSNLPAQRNANAQVQVIPLDPATQEAVETELKGNPNYRVKTTPKASDRAVRDESSNLPDPAARDRIFEQAGLSAPLRHWDALERDLLWIRSLKLPVPELAKKYRGKLSEKSLRRLKDLQKKAGNG